jgi:hypothetical protein
MNKGRREDAAHPLCSREIGHGNADAFENMSGSGQEIEPALAELETVAP